MTIIKILDGVIFTQDKKFDTLIRAFLLKKYIKLPLLIIINNVERILLFKYHNSGILEYV